MFSVRVSPSATAMPDPLSMASCGDARSPRNAPRGGICSLSGQFVGFAPGSSQKGSRPPAFAAGRQGGEAPWSGWIFWIYPCKGASGKNEREGMRSEISRDGRMTTGWAATSPYVRLLRCLYSMQCLCRIPGQIGDPRRISGLRRSLPVSRPARTPDLRLLSCNCFPSLMAFLQFPRVSL